MGTCEETVPVGPVVITFRSEYKGGFKARLTVSNETVAVIGNDDMKTIVIDTLDEHEMIVIEKV